MTLTEKQNLATTYIQAYEDSINGLLGIQYWLYYPYHDDPGNDPHQHDWWYFWVVYDMNAHKPTQAIYDFHHNVRVKDFDYLIQHGYTEDGFHPKVYCDAGGHRSLWSIDERSISFLVNVPENVQKDKAKDAAGYGTLIPKQANIHITDSNKITKDPTFDLMIVGQSGRNIIPFDIDLQLILYSTLNKAYYITETADNEGSIPWGWGWAITQEIWKEGREGWKDPIWWPGNEGTPSDKKYLDHSGVAAGADQLAVGQNGHWRGTMTTFVEGTKLKVEDFNMVWVYDTKDTSKIQHTFPEKDPNNLYGDAGQQLSVYVGFTETSPINLIGKEYWPATDTNGKSTHAPWTINQPTNTVQQAWEWNTAGTHSSPQSPTRSEIYSDSSTGANNQNIMDFARGAGDNDGRWNP